jgi:hypothetical protein
MRLHDFRSVSSGKAPDNITGCVSHMGSNRMRAEVYVINESFLKYGNETSQTVGQKQTSSAELSQSQTASMPGRIGIRVVEKI